MFVSEIEVADTPQFLEGVRGKREQERSGATLPRVDSHGAGMAAKPRASEASTSHILREQDEGCSFSQHEPMGVKWSRLSAARTGVATAERRPVGSFACSEVLCQSPIVPLRALCALA
jgi:hypothetical protein